MKNSFTALPENLFIEQLMPLKSPLPLKFFGGYDTAQSGLRLLMYLRVTLIYSLPVFLPSAGIRAYTITANLKY